MINNDINYIISPKGEGVGELDINFYNMFISYCNLDTNKHKFNSSKTDLLCFVVNGKGEVKLNNKNVDDVFRGHVIYIPKQFDFWLYSSLDSNLELYILSLDVLDNKTFFSTLGFTKTNYLKILDSNVISLAQDLYEMVSNQKDTNNFKKLSIIFDIFSRLTQKTENFNREENDIGYINQALSYIHAKYYDDISVNEIADCLHLNRSYFSVIFKKKMGISPREYLIKFRIKQACKLLKMQRNVIDVASFTGFNSPSNFSVHFKSLMNMTPTEYKNKYVNQGENDEKNI